MQTSNNRGWELWIKLPIPNVDRQIMRSLMSNYVNSIMNAKQGEGVEGSWNRDGKALFIGWISKKDLSGVVDGVLMIRRQFY